MPRKNRSSVLKMNNNWDKSNDKQNISHEYTRFGNIKSIYQLEIAYNNTISDVAIGSACVSLEQDTFYSDSCTRIFHPGTPNGAEQGVPDALFQIPSENPASVGGACW